MKEILATENAPAAIGPYAQGIFCAPFIFTSGQLPINMQTGTLESEPMAATRAAIKNCAAVLAEKGATLADVIKTTVFVADLSMFNQINTAYSEFFAENTPARACVEVARLPKDAVLEIEMIACIA